jgi:hypothetical protein
LKDNQVDLLNTVKPLLADTDEQWADRSHISHGAVMAVPSSARYG